MKHFILILSALTAFSTCIDSIHSKLKTSISSYVFLSGKGVNDLGHYNECLEDKSSDYTLLVANFLEIHVTLGLCHSKTCTKSDIKTAFHTFLSLAAPNLDKSDLSLELLSPKSFDSRSFSTPTLITLIAFLIYSLLISYSSFLYFQGQGSNDSFLKQVLIQFALQKNIKSMIQTTKSNDALQCLNGIRVLASVSLMLVHILVYFYRVSFSNIESAVDYSTDFNHKFIYMFLYNVDIFFVVSGLLLSFLVIPEIRRKKDLFSWKSLFLRRFIRCAPVNYVVCFFVLYLLNYCGSGPQWPMIEKVFPVCEDYWWTNLLYIQNLIPFNKSPCIGWTWYVTIDFQFYLLSPLIIIPYLKRKTFGYLSCLFFLTGSFIYIFIISSANEFTPTFLEGFSKSKQNGLLYVKPFSRVSPFLIGLTIGFIYRNYIDSLSGKEDEDSWGSKFEAFCIDCIKNNSIRKSLYFAGFLVVVWVNFIVDRIDGDKRDNWSQQQKTWFLVFHRFLFSLGFCFLFFPMLFGFGREVWKFLAAQVFQVFAKISYSLYMVHCIVIMFFYFSMSQSQVVDDFRIFETFCSLLVVAQVAAFVLAATVELPAISLEKRFLRD